MMNSQMTKILMIALLALVAVFAFGGGEALANGDSWGISDWNEVDNTEDSPVKNLGGWVINQLMYLYAVLVAVVSIIFIIKHQYSKLAAFLVIAIIVAIPIFAPSALPDIAKAISKALSGSSGG